MFQQWFIMSISDAAPPRVHTSPSHQRRTSTSVSQTSVQRIWRAARGKDWIKHVQEISQVCSSRFGNWFKIWYKYFSKGSSKNCYALLTSFKYKILKIQKERKTNLLEIWINCKAMFISQSVLQVVNYCCFRTHPHINQLFMKSCNGIQVISTSSWNCELLENFAK